MNLDAIITALLRVETKGESTLIMSDCIRSLVAMNQKAKEETDETVKEETDETVHDS